MPSEKVDLGDKDLVVKSLRVLNRLDSQEMGTIVTRISQAESKLTTIAGVIPESAISGYLANPSSLLSSSYDGIVRTYSESGTIISVLEGSEVLTFTEGTPEAGEFAIGTPTVVPSGKITVGGISGGGTDSALVADHSGMDSSTDSVVITFPITVVRMNGNETTLELKQTVVKQKDGVPGEAIKITPSAPVVFRHSDSNYHPSSITFSATDSSGDPYAGRWKLWRGKHLEYSSTEDEETATITCDIAPSDTLALDDDLGFGSSSFRAELYAEGGFDIYLASCTTSTLNDVEGFADTYADAARQLAEVTAAAYADGIVTAEEARAIADAQAKADAALAEAMAYADTLASELQSQIDGAITSWFYDYVPSLVNLPASDWTTTALKDDHLGDLFYDTDTGYAYRFQFVDPDYTWQQLADTAATEALALASAAQDTADRKRTTFASLSAAQNATTGGEPGDLFLEGGLFYRALQTKGSITLANSTRLTPKKHANATVATVPATGCILGDTIYCTDTLQWYAHNGSAWVADGIAQDAAKTWIQELAPTIGARTSGNAVNGDTWIKTGGGNLSYLAVSGAWVLKGQAAKISCSAPMVFRKSDGSYLPSSVTFTASTPAGTAYAGYWVLYRNNYSEINDGVAAYSKTITCDIAPSDTLALDDDLGFGSSTFRAELYADAALTVLIDRFATATMSDVEGFSESYAAAAAEVARVTAQAYADGKADAAELAAIEAAEAAAYLAQVTAQAYADGIVSEEEERAIADATAKANAAQAEAVRLAALDATGKADAAKSYAEDLAGEVQAQFDHAITNWYQASTSDPATTWTTDQLKRDHHGDHWKKTDLGTWWTYRKTGANTGTWDAVTDGPAIDALDDASTAAAIANGKNTTFESLSEAQAHAVVGDLFLYAGLLYRVLVAGVTLSIDPSKSTRLTPKRHEDMQSDELPTTGVIFGDTIYATDTRQFYVFTTEWVKDGPALTAEGVGASALIDQLAGQTDHMITYWYNADDSDPKTAWTSDALRTAHNGDLWKKATAGTWWRYARLTEFSGEWVQITDGGTISTLDAASTAQVTADGKLDIFAARPESGAYAVGDLWYNKDAKKLYVCTTPRNGSGWSVNDWSVVVPTEAGDVGAVAADDVSALVPRYLGRVATLPSSAVDGDTVLRYNSDDALCGIFKRVSGSWGTKLDATALALPENNVIIANAWTDILWAVSSSSGPYPSDIHAGTMALKIAAYVGSGLTFIDLLGINIALINKLFANAIVLQSGGAIKSSTYDSNPDSEGFCINHDGTAVFNEVTVRGAFDGIVDATEVSISRVQPGNNIVKEDNAVVSTISSTMTVLKTERICASGWVRVVFELNCSYLGCHYYITVNGTPFFSQKTKADAGWETFVEVIEIAEGSEISLEVASHSSYPVSSRGFAICIQGNPGILKYL